MSRRRSPAPDRGRRCLHSNRASVPRGLSGWRRVRPGSEDPSAVREPRPSDAADLLPDDVAVPDQHPHRRSEPGEPPGSGSSAPVPSARRSASRSAGPAGRSPASPARDAGATGPVHRRSCPARAASPRRPRSLDEAELIVLAVPDDAIAEVAGSIRLDQRPGPRPHQRPARRGGARAGDGGRHPARRVPSARRVRRHRAGRRGAPRRHRRASRATIDLVAAARRGWPRRSAPPRSASRPAPRRRTTRRRCCPRVAWWRCSTPSRSSASVAGLDEHGGARHLSAAGPPDARQRRRAGHPRRPDGAVHARRRGHARRPPGRAASPRAGRPGALSRPRTARVGGRAGTWRTDTGAGLAARRFTCKGRLTR